MYGLAKDIEFGEHPVRSHVPGVNIYSFLDRQKQMMEEQEAREAGQPLEELYPNLYGSNYGRAAQNFREGLGQAATFGAADNAQLAPLEGQSTASTITAQAAGGVGELVGAVTGPLKISAAIAGQFITLPRLAKASPVVAALATKSPRLAAKLVASARAAASVGGLEVLKVPREGETLGDRATAIANMAIAGSIGGLGTRAYVPGLEGGLNILGTQISEKVLGLAPTPFAAITGNASIDQAISDFVIGEAFRLQQGDFSGAKGRKAVEAEAEAVRADQATRPAPGSLLGLRVPEGTP
jgi:hypothetical protein